MHQIDIKSAQRVHGGDALLANTVYGAIIGAASFGGLNWALAKTVTGTSPTSTTLNYAVSMGGGSFVGALCAYIMTNSLDYVFRP